MLGKISGVLALATTVVGVLTTVDWAAFAALPSTAKLGILVTLIGSLWQAITKPVTPSTPGQSED